MSDKEKIPTHEQAELAFRVLSNQFGCADFATEVSSLKNILTAEHQSRLLDVVMRFVEGCDNEDLKDFYSAVYQASIFIEHRLKDERFVIFREALEPIYNAFIAQLVKVGSLPDSPIPLVRDGQLPVRGL